MALNISIPTRLKVEAKALAKRRRLPLSSLVCNLLDAEIEQQRIADAIHKARLDNPAAFEQEATTASDASGRPLG